MFAKLRYGTTRRPRPGPALTTPFLFSLDSLLALALPLVRALTFNTPKNVISGDEVTLTWTWSGGTDPPTFTLELFGELSHNEYTLAKNVRSSAGSISFEFPSVPLRYVHWMRCARFCFREATMY